MPHNVLMSKIRCYNPNKNHSALKNLNYVMYIATRPGVDLTDVEFDKLTSLIEETENTHNLEHSKNHQYIHYIAKRQNSQGLFGNFAFSSPTEVAREVRDVTDMGVNVYRGIISLSEEDAIELGFDKKEAWVDYMNSIMNDVGNKFGIPITSLKWCAAVHMEQGHPHCHYTFWRTDGKVMSSYIHTSLQNEVREFLSGEMFKAERELEVTNKTHYRDSVLHETHSILDSLNKQDFHHIPNRITAEQLKGLTSDLTELINALPGKGRLSYKLIPPACKALVDKAVNDIINIPAVNKEYAAYLKAVSSISATYSPSDKHDIVNKSIADEDIRKRIANSILKSCRSLTLVQEQLLSSEPSSPEHDFLPDEIKPESSMPDFDAIEDEPDFILSSPDDLQVNSVHSTTYDDAQMNSVHSIPDDTQVNSVHSIPDNTQVNSVHSNAALTPEQHTILDELNLIKDGIREDIFCPMLEWTKEFKSTRESLYQLKKDDPEYNKKFRDILNTLAAFHNEGDLPATYLLARMYNSKKYSIYDESKSQQLYALSYNNFLSAYNLTDTQITSGTYKNADDEKFTSIKYNYLSYHLGKMSERGLGCEINYNDAAKYYSNCIEDNAYAQYGLANIYLGEKLSPLTHDIYSEAMGLLKKASDSIPYAVYQYAQNLENPRYPDFLGSDEEIYNNYKKALDGFLAQEKEDSALDGNILYKIGKMYYEGKGCIRDTEKAYEYFLKAAEDGNKHAYYALGKTCADEKSPHYNPLLAESYYLKAYEQHQPLYLKLALANLYATPDQEVYNIQKALQLYKSCVETDSDSYAMYKLGTIYLFGKGVEKNEELGLKYLNDAVDHGNEYAKETLEFYNNMKHSMTVSAAYSLTYHFLSMLCDRHNQHQMLQFDHRLRSTSKEARIDAYDKNQEHSSADFDS